MAYLHSLEIAHRDIKPENIFIQDDGSIRLGDFGCATSFSESLTSKSSIGTEDYFSPELKLLSLGKRETYPVAAQDVWAIGVVIYEMWNGSRFQRGSRLRWRREPPSDLIDLVESITLSSEQ